MNSNIFKSLAAYSTDLGIDITEESIKTFVIETTENRKLRELVKMQVITKSEAELALSSRLPTWLVNYGADSEHVNIIMSKLGSVNDIQSILDMNS